MARRTLDFLPQVFRTETNKRFLNATVDQLVSEPLMTRFSSYVGRAENSPVFKAGDPYIREGDSFNQYYQLEPSTVIRRRTEGIPDDYKIDNVYNYLDLLNQISSNGGLNNDHNRLFKQEYYNYQGFVDLEKLINYAQYYWVPEGPGTVDVYAGDMESQKDFYITTEGNTITNDGFQSQITGNYAHHISGFGAASNPTITLVRGGSYNFVLNQAGYPFYIQSQPGDLEAVDWQENISRREVFGVVDNGSETGTVTFNVPKKIAQEEFVVMPQLDPVDITLDIPFIDVQDQPLADVFAKYSFDGIKTDVTNKKMIFKNFFDDTWPETVTKEQRKGIWQFRVDDLGICRLTYLQDWPANYKVFVKEGRTYGNRFLYKDSTLFVRIMPPITAELDTLYYQSPVYGFGVIKLIEPSADAVLTISDILGSENYTSPNGIHFTNGLKIRFTNVVEPETYKNETYVVEGVGKAITLHKWSTFVTPETFVTNTSLTGTNSPADKEYIVINRSSLDGNPWTRTNRWFHKDLLAYTASVLTPGVGYSYNEADRAKRPIVEFLPNLYLFDGALNYLGDIDLIDVTCTDAFSLVEGQETYTIDGVELADGMRVIFNADTTDTTRAQIYTVNLVDVIGLGTDYQIHLEPYVTATNGDSVVAKVGDTRQGQWWVWSETNKSWSATQQKNYTQQEPLFDVFYYDKTTAADYSLSDGTFFTSTTFTGNKLFGYKKNNSATADAELGFGITYKTLGNIGDILFENSFDTDTFNYSLNNADEVININVGNPKVVESDKSLTSKNPWTKVKEYSKQYVEKMFTATINSVNDFQIAVSYIPSSTEKNSFITVNGLPVTDYQLLKNGDYTIIRLPLDLAVGDYLIAKIFGTVGTNRNLFTVPKNLERNTFNDTFSGVTLGQLRNHLIEMSRNSLSFNGDATGNNNFRDIDYFASSGTILQHSAPVHHAQVLLNNDSTDVIQSLDFSRREYNRFKDRFLNLLETMEFADQTDYPSIVDQVMSEICVGASVNLPFYYTDMAAVNQDFDITQYTVFDPGDKTYNATYPYGFNTVYDQVYDPYRTILVYHQQQLIEPVSGKVSYTAPQQLLVDTDYTVTGKVVNISADFTLTRDDLLTFKEYKTTKGCMIPATPSKLGIYPKFKPSISLDDTYLDPVNVIQGHDGSVTVAFDDFRDNVILELERRIYNNIRVDHNAGVLQSQNVAPGAFRITDYSYDEWTQLLSHNYLEWAGTNNVDTFENTTSSSNDLFSINYSEATDKLYNELVPGYWRGIYDYFYDTDRPHLAPWEMVGFSEQPAYWEFKYGPAPYSSGNQVMWDDIENGIIWTDPAGTGIYETSTVNDLYIRPGLSSILPVDEHGFLLPPQYCLIDKYNILTAGKKWRFGDQGPVESAWRKSSDYPFAAMIAYALARPAEFCAFSFNLRDYGYDSQLDQIINTTTNNRKITSAISDDTNLVPGVNVFIRDRLTSLGLDVLTNLVYILDDVSINLAYKMAGYTDKKYLQILAEQSSPQSRNTGVLIPDENYDVVLTKSAPVSKITYSAVIIERAQGGWNVRGFDVNRPYFNIIPSLANNNSYSITVGQTSATVYRDGDDQTFAIPYGTTFTSKQQVSDFLISYGRYLIANGFTFSEFLPDQTTVKDWTLAVKEFLFFTQQSWDDNTIISLTPAESQIKFDTGISVVEDMNNSFTGTRIVDSDNKVVKIKDYRVYRDGTSFELTLKDTTKGIHLVDLRTVQYEHTLVFDNTTVFNDVIYQPILGNRQQRLKLVGRKTKGWDGSLRAPGFLVNHRPVDPWSSLTDYHKGDIVTHKNKYFTAKTFLPGSPRFDQNDWYEITNGILAQKLIPNPAFNAQQFEGFYDVDSIDVNVNADLQGRHATGFQPRKYFTDIGLDEISQHKFYLGMISEKGTNASINKFLRAKLPYIENDLTIREEWAFSSGSYGNTENADDIELSLTQAKQINNSVILELLDKNDARSNRWNTFKVQDLNYVPSNYSKNLFTKTNAKRNIIPNAGYVLLNEVDATVFNVNKIENISGLAPIMSEGSRIWVGSDIDNDWRVYRATNDYGVYADSVANINDTELEFTTPRPHGLQLRDKIMVRNASIRQLADTGGFRTIDMSGVYRVTAVSARRFRVQLSDPTRAASGNIKSPIFKLQNVRYDSRSDFASDIPYRGWKEGDKVYIDDVSGKWQVLKNTNSWQLSEILSSSEVTAEDDFAKSMIMTSDQRTLVIGSGLDTGKLYIYGVDDFNQWNEIQQITAEIGTDFATSMAINDDNWMFVGAPGSSTNTGYVYIYKMSSGITEATQVIYDSFRSTGDRLGDAIAASKDGQWLYLSATGTEEVDVYRKIAVTADSETYSGNGVTQTFNLPASVSGIGLTADDIKVFINGSILVPNIEYTINVGTTAVTLVSVPTALEEVVVEYSDYFIYMDTIANPALFGTGFGVSIACSTDGKTLVVGANAETVSNDGSVYDLQGGAYVYDRSVESFITDGSTASYTTLYSPNEPTVYVDDVDIGDAYTLVGSTFVLDDVPDVASIVTIETNNFRKQVRLNPDANQANMYYGTSVVICPNNCSIYVGATGYKTGYGDPGAVFRNLNIPKTYGKITGTISNPVLASGTQTLRINNFTVTFTGTSLDTVISNINAKNIPGVTASKTVDNRLVLTTDSELTYNKLILVEDNGTPLAQLGMELFSQVQRIDTIYQQDGASFGENLAISPDARNILVGTTKASTPIDAVYDGGTTYFDGRTTNFVDIKYRSGAVYLYEYQPSSTETSVDVGKFTFATRFYDSTMQDEDQFGRSTFITSNWVIAGAPKGNLSGVDKGVFYVFNNSSANPVWNVEREQPDTADSFKLTRAFIYDTKDNTILTELPVIDSQYGKFMPAAMGQIDFMTNYDPAVYNQVPNRNTFNYDRRTPWGKAQVGKLWWDTNSVKYVDWNQGTLINKSNNRDLLFPSASIDIYEWVESRLPPGQYNATYSGIGISSLYTVNEVYSLITDSNPLTDANESLYYFWVKHTAVGNNPQHKIFEIQQALQNPRNTNEPYIALLAPNAVALYNCQDYIGGNSMLKMQFNRMDEVLPIHRQWSLFNDGTRLGVAQNIFDKIVDSVGGIDAEGRFVPDNNLKEKQRYGFGIRPRQTVFADVDKARKLIHDFINSFFGNYPVALVRNLDEFLAFDPEPDITNYDDDVATDVELGYLDYDTYLGLTVLVHNDALTGGWTLRRLDTVLHGAETAYEWTVLKSQTYNNQLYWDYADWYAEGYDTNSVPDHTVDFSYDIGQITIRNNQLIKINNSIAGGWQLVKVADSKLQLVGQQNATLMLRDSFYNSQTGGFGIDDRSFESVGFSKDNYIEVRNITLAFCNMLTANAGSFVEEFRAYYNQLIEFIVNLINSQFLETEWMFKTSFISISHTIRQLSQIPIYVKQPEALVENYISEIKPYHAKIRKYVSRYPGSDNSQTYTTDFDLPSYLTDSYTYRSPDITNPKEQQKFEQYPYKSWTDNYKYGVVQVKIVDGGSGYTNETILTFVGGDGAGVKAAVSVNGLGSITSVTMLANGDGFTYPPEIIVEGIGTGALLVAQLGNSKVRTIKTVLTFDRYTYNSTITEWQSNHTYIIDDVLIYNYIPYRVTQNFVSGTIPDLTYAIPYKLYRWQPRTKYFVGDIIVSDWANEISWEATENFVSGDVFDDTFLIAYFGPLLDNAADRIWSYYNPSKGQPGRDLTQVISGIEYPGIKVTGNPFLDDGSTLDTTLYSSFTDTQLGIRPEDMITDGSGYVDTYSSHAPEEFLPGKMFDALSIKVTQVTGEDLLGDGAGPDCSVTGSYATGSARYPFNRNVIGGVEKLIVFTANTGYLSEGHDYYVDWTTSEIVFADPIVDTTDIVFAMSIGSTGEKIFDSYEYYARMLQTIFTMQDTKVSLAKQVYVKVNGQQVTSGYSITWDDTKIPAFEQFTQYYLNDLISYDGDVYKVNEDFISGVAPSMVLLDPYDYEAVVKFDNPLTPDDFVQIHVFNESSTRKAYSSIKEINYTLLGTPTYPDDYVFDLPEIMQYDDPWNSNLSIRLNGEMLAPGNNTYYLGDGSTVNFTMPTSGVTDPTNIVDTDIHVIVDGDLKVQSTHYTVTIDGSSYPLITFLSAPVDGAKITINDSSAADYTVISNSQLLIKPTLVIQDGSATNLQEGQQVTIIQYSNHDMYNMRTQVFKGTKVTTTVSGGFDVQGWDNSGFDTDYSTTIGDPIYDLSRPVLNESFLQVYINGHPAAPVYDYRLENEGTKLRISGDFGLTATDVVHIRHFSEITRASTLKWRTFKDMNDNTSYTGIGYTTSTRLMQPLSIEDNTIFLEDTSKLNSPGIAANEPGVIFIQGERITYWSKDDTNNTVTNIRRSTAGTGAAAYYDTGTVVEDGSMGVEIPGTPDTIWYDIVGGGQIGPDGSTLVVKTEGKSLHDTNTIPVRYLKSISR